MKTARGVIARRGVVAVVGACAAKLRICCEASAADATPGLSMGSAVGALVSDVCAGLSVGCAVGAFAAAGGMGVVAAKHV